MKMKMNGFENVAIKAMDKKDTDGTGHNQVSIPKSKLIELNNTVIDKTTLIKTLKEADREGAMNDVMIEFPIRETKRRWGTTRFDRATKIATKAIIYRPSVMVVLHELAHVLQMNSNDPIVKNSKPHGAQFARKLENLIKTYEAIANPENEMAKAATNNKKKDEQKKAPKKEQKKEKAPEGQGKQKKAATKKKKFTRIDAVVAVLRTRTYQDKDQIIKHADNYYRNQTGKHAANHSETKWALRMAIQTLEAMELIEDKGDKVEYKY